MGLEGCVGVSWWKGEKRTKWRPLNSAKEDREGNAPLEKGLQEPYLSYNPGVQAQYVSLGEWMSPAGDESWGSSPTGKGTTPTRS